MALGRSRMWGTVGRYWKQGERWLDDDRERQRSSHQKGQNTLMLGELLESGGRQTEVPSFVDTSRPDGATVASDDAKVRSATDDS